jgi:hypothetical protein
MTAVILHLPHSILYVNCDSYTQTFMNEAPPSSLIHTYTWDFGIPGRNDDTSTQITPSFTFPDTGTFLIRLIINRGEDCPDSATTLMKVYPGFYAGFTHIGACMISPSNSLTQLKPSTEV